MLRWLARALPERIPDAKCPQCGCLDLAPVGVIERSSVTGKGRKTGTRYRCVKCSHPFGVSLDGIVEADVPTPRPAVPAGEREEAERRARAGRLKNGDGDVIARWQ